MQLLITLGSQLLIDSARAVGGLIYVIKALGRVLCVLGNVNIVFIIVLAGLISIKLVLMSLIWGQISSELLLLDGLELCLLVHR